MNISPSNSLPVMLLNKIFHQNAAFSIHGLLHTIVLVSLYIYMYLNGNFVRVLLRLEHNDESSGFAQDI